MKKIILFCFVAFLLGLGSVNSWAIPLSVVKVDPNATVNVTIPVIGRTLDVLAGEYILDIQGMGRFAGFCVDPAYSPSGSQDYTITSLPDELKYEQAAYLFQKYGSAFNGSTSRDTAANVQLAIWELIFDPENYNTGEGNFKVTLSSWQASSQTYVDEAKNADTKSFDPSAYGIVLARNPSVDSYGKGYQDYMFRVPEPASIIMLGLGLLGVGVFGIRRQKGRK